MKPESPRQEPGRQPALERRDLLKSLGLGAAGAAAATMLPDAAAQATESPQEQVKARYRETDHVKRFYALNRL